MYLTQIHKDPAKGMSGTEAISEFNKISYHSLMVNL